ncbi:MAG TPA: EscU/YscU/HrcU family type III secretion system export apparatus switch protein [Pirellulales bacterium]|nr:EscU/YscU/HrcU family type III secretion system export apparatus switch protein [Pirellulales bacterium]
MADFSFDKSLEPTPRRRQQAREEGQVAQSADLASAGMLISGLVILLVLGGQLVEFFARLARHQLGGESWLEVDSGFLISHFNAVLLELGRSLAPILGFMLMAAVLVHVLQTGLLWAPNRISPDIQRINPLSGFQRLFSLSSAVRLSMGLFKVVMVSLVAFWSLYHRRDEILGVAALEVPQIAAFVVDIIIWTSLKIALALLVLAIFDYGYQRWKYERDLRMTPQEMREEMKNLQGNPQVVARRRQVHRQLTLSGIAATVHKADLVVTNQAELAVAIQYDPATMSAPIVLVKGAGAVARQIEQLALQHNIPVVTRKILAQSLDQEVDINRPVSDKMYAEVAELLAHAYQRKNKGQPELTA